MLPYKLLIVGGLQKDAGAPPAQERSNIPPHYRTRCGDSPWISLDLIKWMIWAELFPEDQEHPKPLHLVKYFTFFSHLHQPQPFSWIVEKTNGDCWLYTGEIMYCPFPNLKDRVPGREVLEKGDQLHFPEKWVNNLLALVAEGIVEVILMTGDSGPSYWGVDIHNIPSPLTNLQVQLLLQSSSLQELAAA